MAQRCTASALKHCNKTSQNERVSCFQNLAYTTIMTPHYVDIFAKSETTLGEL